MVAATAAPPPTSAAVSGGRIIEHVMFFKVKPSTPPSTIAAWLAPLNALSASVPSVLHLVASPFLHTDSPFTHLLHPHYPSPAALAVYSSHPEHLAVVHQGGPMREDIMALDWVSQEPGAVESRIIDPGKVMKVTFLKLKEGKEEGAEEDVIKGIKGKVGVGDLEALTIGLGGGFCGREEMDAADKMEVPGGGPRGSRDSWRRSSQCGAGEVKIAADL